MRLKLLDLYCGAGGCSKGYDLTGFEVVGCDIEVQKCYPFAFVQADALTLLDDLLKGGNCTASDGKSYCLSDFAAIHASPPCQDSTVLKSLNKGKEYPKLIGPTRERLIATGLPYVIENVVPRKHAAERLIDPILLCGTMFGLQTSCGAELRRHRLFEINWGPILVPECQHYASVVGVCGSKSYNPATYRAEERFPRRTVTVTGHSPMEGKRKVISITGHTPENRALPRPKTITVTGATPQQNVVRNTLREIFPVSAAREAMGIDWMTMKELSQAIPPAYTRFIGRALREIVG